MIRHQINVRLSSTAREQLERLQAHYTEKLGVPVSQAQLIELLLKQDAQREGIESGHKRRRGNQ